MKALDFKNFKKVSQDKETVTMQHPKGHKIIVAVKALPKIQQEQLKRLKIDIDESKVQRFAGDGDPSDSVVQPQDNAQDPNAQPPVTVNVNQAPTATPTPVPAQPSAAAEQGNTPVNVQQPNVRTNNPNVLLPNGSMSAPGVAQTGQEAVVNQQKVEAAQAQSMVPVEQAYVKAQAQQAQQIQDNINALKVHADNLAGNLQKIDPKAYVHNMSAPTKVATGIGLFLGGLGAANGGHNYAQDFLNQQIDRDVNAQVQNNQNQKTIFGAYNELYGNQKVAADMATKTMADIYASQVRQIAQKFGTPASLVRSQQLQAELAAKGNKAILDAGGSLTALRGNNPGDLNNPVNSMTANSIPNQNNPGTGGPTAGLPKANANEEKPVIKPDPYADTPILQPDAQGKLDDLQFGSPQQRAKYPEAFKQYTQAQQADTILGQLHEVHQDLYKEAQQGGSKGYFRRHDPTASIPVAGHALSQMLVQPITDTQVNRNYDTNKTRIVGDIANALRGTNISGEEIQKIVDDNTPEHGDSPETVARKERAIRIFIKNSVPKSLLKDTEMTK